MAHKVISTSVYLMNTGNHNSLKSILIHFNFSHVIKQDIICTSIGLKQQTSLRMESAKLYCTTAAASWK